MTKQVKKCQNKKISIQQKKSLIIKKIINRLIFGTNYDIKEAELKTRNYGRI